MSYVNDPMWDDLFGTDTFTPIPMDSYNHSFLMTLFELFTDIAFPLAFLTLFFPVVLCLGIYIGYFALVDLVLVRGGKVWIPAIIFGLIRPIFWFFGALWTYLDRGIEFGLVLASAEIQKAQRDGTLPPPLF